MTVKEVMRKDKVKSYMSVSEDIFPFILNYHGKEYEIRYTSRGGLIMKGYEYVQTENIDVLKKE